MPALNPKQWLTQASTTQRVTFLIFILLIVSSFLLLFPYQSQYLGEWDSIQFGMALQEYDLAKYQPHPPGYPLYISLAWIIFQVSRNALTALTAVSVVSASLTLGIFLLFARSLFNDLRWGLTASLLLLATPMFFFTSLRPLSDVPALFFIILSLYLAYRYLQNGQTVWILTGLFIAGLGCGVRITNALCLLPFVYVMFRRASKKQLLWSFLCFSTSILLWLIPLAIIGANGFYEYFSITTRQWNRAVIQNDSIFYGNPIQNLWMRSTRDLAFVYSAFGFGGSQGYGLEPWEVLRLWVFIGLVVYGLLTLKFSSKGGKFLLAWVLPYLGFLTIFMSIYGAERYLLPTIPVVVLGMTYALKEVFDNGFYKSIRFPIRPFTKILTVGFVIFLFLSFSLYGARIVHAEPPPTIQMVDYVKAHYPPDKVIIIAEYDLRTFQYYAQEYQCIWWYDGKYVFDELRHTNSSQFQGRDVLVDGGSLAAYKGLYPSANFVLVASFRGSAWNIAAMGNNLQLYVFRLRQ